MALQQRLYGLLPVRRQKTLRPYLWNNWWKTSEWSKNAIFGAMAADTVASPDDSALLFKGGGEMGRRTREFDWTSTPVGPIHTWPASLLSAVNIVLSSRFPMFIWWGPELIQFYNDAYRPSMGNTGKHPMALGQRGEECWPEIWPVIYPLIRQVMDGGDATWSEDQLIPIYRNGCLEDVYWTFSYSPIILQDSQVGGVLVVCSENTEKVMNYQRLKESEDELSFALEAAELGTWDLNPLTGKFTANRRLKSWFGLHPGQEIELTYAIAAIAPGDRDRVARDIEQALDPVLGGYYDTKYTIINKVTGEERVVRARGRAWFNEDKVAWRFNGTLQDITDTEITHLELQQANLKSRLAIESAELGSYELDLQTEQIVTSERFNTIWNIRPPVTHQQLIDLIYEDDRAARRRAHLEALNSGHIDYTSRITSFGDDERWVRVKGAVTHDAEGRPLMLVGVVQDITHQKKTEDVLTRLVEARTEELQRSNSDLLQFAHVISHDLKEPVRKILIYTHRIQDEMSEHLPAEGQKYLMKVIQSSNRMVAMIEGVLQYSTISSSTEAFTQNATEEIIQQVCDDLEIAIQQKSASINFSGDPHVFGIPVLLYQLFYNLINNSLKFSRPGVAPVIDISAFSEGGGNVRITVTDNGIGFEKIYAKDIFGSFTRLHSKDAFEGTGLGLALVKKIVDRHHGTIYAIGTPGEGASFVFTLPTN